MKKLIEFFVMSQLYRLLTSPVKLLYKAQHHKGHGIHSPFAYSFIRDVIEEKIPYYGYADIYYLLSEEFPDWVCDTKTQKLLFKTVNYFKVQNLLILGAGNGVNTFYLTAPSSKIKCMGVETDVSNNNLARDLYSKWKRDIEQSTDPFPTLSYAPDCIYVNLNNYKVDPETLIIYILSLVSSHSLVIIEGIRTNYRTQMLWKRFIGHDDIRVSMDLFEIGILFFDKKFFKQNYRLSF